MGYTFDVMKNEDLFYNLRRGSIKKPNVFKVGSPTISNGIFSNFSLTDYVILPEVFNVGSYNWEMLFKFNINTLNVNSYLFSSPERNYQPISINVQTDNTLCLRSYSNDSSTQMFNIVSQSTLDVNTDYYVKVTFDPSSGYFLYLGTTKDNLTLEASTDVTSPLTLMDKLALGNNFTGLYVAQEDRWLRGSIDLNESYIKINDELWWSGVKYGNNSYLLIKEKNNG